MVPNKHPDLPDHLNRRLAIVGEAPGEDEETVGEPFVGPSGKLLQAVLESFNLSRRSCLIANICQHRPSNNDISSFDWQGPEIQGGLAQLERDLEAFHPNAILALGRTAFRYFRPDKCYQGKKSKFNPTGYVIPLQDWRGSIFPDFRGRKVIAAFHPAYIQRAFGDIAYFRNDLGRAVRQSENPSIRGIVRSGTLRPTLQEVLSFLHYLRQSHQSASFDIEGYSDSLGITMLSICPTPTTGIVIPFYIDGTHYWSAEDEPLIWQALAAYLADPLCPKKGHNLFYETLVLGWRHQCVVDGIVSDTMMKHWEYYNELEKSLAVATSMWTEEPYYKDERESGQSDRKLLYNFKDSALTEEIDLAIEPALAQHPAAYQHFLFNVRLIHPFTYLHLRGCRFDADRARTHLQTASTELAEILERIDKVTLPVLGHPFNPKSTDDKQWLLYEFLDHEPFKRYGPTTKEEIMHRLYKRRKDAVLLDCIRAVGLRTRISDIEKLAPSADGRLRTAYNIVADVTGRSNSTESSIAQEYATKKGLLKHEFDGTNLQNVTKAVRDVCVPDSPDYDFFQADLKGADAWTVAADLFALGHPRMLEDLRAGVKPALLLLAMLEVLEAGGDPSIIARCTSDEALTYCAQVHVPKGILPDGRPGDWKYLSAKRVQHGTNYEGQAETISAVLFKDSDGVIDVLPRDIEKYQWLYRLRYNTSARTRWMQTHLAESGGVLQTACGIRRRFFGIRSTYKIDDSIIRDALASEPQANTTFLTNRALERLWYDPDNRRCNGALFIDPLLQIHDALAGQFPRRLREFARTKLHDYFNNSLTIHGVEIRIPVDIKTGPNWGECETTL